MIEFNLLKQQYVEHMMCDAPRKTSHRRDIYTHGEFKRPYSFITPWPGDGDGYGNGGGGKNTFNGHYNRDETSVY